MYGISKDLEINDSVRFTGGITEGVVIEKISYENSKKDGTGNNVLAFHFKGPKGQTFRHVEWPVDESDASAETKLANLSKRIKHILSKFMPAEQVVIGAVSSFEEYAKAVIALAGNKYQGKTFAIKLVYNDKGNLGFTKYVGFIGNTASDLSVGAKENITPPSATPSTSAEEVTAQPDF